MNEEPKKWKIHHEFIQRFPSKPMDEVSWINSLTDTHYMMIAMDLLELNVEDSKNGDAKQMLAAIGIKT